METYTKLFVALAVICAIGLPEIVGKPAAERDVRNYEAVKSDLKRVLGELQSKLKKGSLLKGDQGDKAERARGSTTPWMSGYWPSSTPPYDNSGSDDDSGSSWQSGSSSPSTGLSGSWSPSTTYEASGSTVSGYESSPTSYTESTSPPHDESTAFVSQGAQESTPNWNGLAELELPENIVDLIEEAGADMRDWIDDIVEEMWDGRTDDMSNAEYIKFKTLIAIRILQAVYSAEERIMVDMDDMVHDTLAEHGLAEWLKKK